MKETAAVIHLTLPGTLVSQVYKRVQALDRTTPQPPACRSLKGMSSASRTHKYSQLPSINIVSSDALSAGAALTDTIHTRVTTAPFNLYERDPVASRSSSMQCCDRGRVASVSWRWRRARDVTARVIRHACCVRWSGHDLSLSQHPPLTAFHFTNEAPLAY
ncbi:unnamed protein product [Danaus chrysippus]|uniref:(African queen) hypothetical protein n=1 Tax=Danaus chrysippus TaxID=151541 RepID=A0A8J2QE54_9NEOP|nr:unnamed protein product [Danaus chrysippus]